MVTRWWRARSLAFAIGASAVCAAMPARADDLATNVNPRTVVATRIDPHGRNSGVIFSDGTDQTNIGPAGAQDTAQGYSRGGGPAVAAPVPYAKVDDASGLDRIASNGRVRMMLHSPAGSPTGFVMEDGTQVFSVPTVADAVAEQVTPGQFVRVEGRGTRTAAGTGMWAISITQPSGLVLLDMNRGIGAPELNLR